MRPLGNILGKEVRELLTPATVLPIVVLAILFGSLGGIMGDVEDEATRPPVIGLVIQDKSQLGNLTAGALMEIGDVVYDGNDLDQGLEKVAAAGGTALLVIPSGFEERILSDNRGIIEVHWIMQGTGVLDTISSTSLDMVLVGVDEVLSRHILEGILEDGLEVSIATALHPTIRDETTTFKGKSMGGISPGAISATLSSQNMVVPMIVLMVIIMAGSTIIASMGLEKENKTLETLLTMPVKRSHIVLGKLGGAAVVGLLMAAIYMLGMGSYINSMQSSAGLDLSKFGIGLEAIDLVLIGVSLFLSLLAGLGLCLVIGVFARDYKSAQSLTMPITFLAMIPMFILMMKDFTTLPAALQAGLFAIPFTHPMMAVNNLMFGDYALVVAGIIYEGVFAAVMMVISVILFKKDILVTGRRRRGKRGTTGPDA